MKLVEKPLHGLHEDELPQVLAARAVLHGWQIDSGLLCMCTSDTYSENLERRLFGMMQNRMAELQRVGDGTALFLFNLSARKITGVFARASAAALNLEPSAWSKCSHSPAVRRRCRCFQSHGSAYPAQIRFQDAPAPFRRCRPVPEDAWEDVLTVAPGQTRSGKPHYELWLSAAQAQELANICMNHGG